MDQLRRGKQRMADCGEQQALRYSAFISYSHRDSAFARRLHRDLENYRLPRRVATRQGAEKSPARRLRPIFRDREELPAAPDLTQAVQRAIAEASYLIVICSQHASTSAWVARELSLFREVHGEGAVLAALVDGADDETLSSIFRAEARGSRAPEPLAADFRKEGDGAQLALLKLVAVLADLRLDDLVQRDAQRRVRRITAVSVAALAGMAAMGALTLVAVNARLVAEQEQARGEALVDYSLSDLRNHLKSIGRLDILSDVNKGALHYYSGQEIEKLPPNALLERAKLLQALGEDEEKRGHLVAAQKQFDDANRMTVALLHASPNDPGRIFAQAQSEYWLGFIAWRLGDDAGAENAFTSYANLAQRLVSIGPNNPDWISEKGYAESNLGMYVLRHSIDTARAGPLFSAALSDFEKAEELRPEDRQLKIEIADGYAWLADVERLREKFLNAINDRQRQRQILNDLLATNQMDFEVRSDIVTNILALARISVARGDLTNAISLLEGDHEYAKVLLHEAPDNTDFAKKVRIVELFEVRAWLMRPPKKRPPSSMISSTLGGCSEEKQKYSNDEELLTFCAIQQAHWCAQTGDNVNARKWVASVEAVIMSQQNKLTSRWGLDFQNELDGVSSASKSQEQR